MTKTKILAIIGGVAGCVPLFLFILNYNPVSNAGEIVIVQNTMKAMEYRFEKRAVIEDIDFLQDELFNTKQGIFKLERKERTQENSKELRVLEERVHELNQRIEYKKDDIQDLKSVMGVK